MEIQGLLLMLVVDSFWMVVGSFLMGTEMGDRNGDRNGDKNGDKNGDRNQGQKVRQKLAFI